ncbi:MAG TPA: UDP-3-O-(3-hydroxymyristoyl)glucosamine N-acyltransferase [Nitrososphaeraceae archaeon]|nr:UDP-3-O-(3-hydroxymyristoyl)glucosamine N-acyltransferase [Nitrososphaeraceae archaeon]
MGWNIESLLSDLRVEYHTNGPTQSKIISGVASIKEATEDELSFCYHGGEKGSSLISQSKAGVILCKKALEGLIQQKPGSQIFYLDNPRFVFVQLMKQIYNKKRNVGISSNAVISKGAKIGFDCYIGDYSVIGENCKIGNNTIISERVSLVQNCSIGDGCIIQPGVTIGADGFAFERYQNGELERFPHIKGVKIGNYVEICANSSIARGSLSDTMIGDGTKIDALVHIAHNVVTGKNCELTAGTIIGGSTTLGDMCWTGLNSTLKDNIKVGNNALIAAGAAVIHDVQDEDIVAGVPAKSIKDKVTSDLLFLMSGQKSK